MKRKQTLLETEKTENVYGMTKDQMIEEVKKINARHKDNMESRKNVLKAVMGGLQMGDKVFVIIPLEDLHIDKTYQRPVQSHIKKLVQEWDSRKCDLLKVNYREDGNLYVWDGQHRLIAMKIKEIDYAMCILTVGLTQEEEAALFGCQGIGIKKPNPYDIFKANVCAGEDIDTSIKAMCDYYNLEVKISKKAGCLTCLSLVRDIFRKGEKEYFEWVLELLDMAKWNEFPQAHSHKIINALYEIRKVSEEENEYIQIRLVNYLKKTNPNDLDINATVRYPQFKGTSKGIKLFFWDVINGEVLEAINTQDRVSA